MSDSPDTASSYWIIKNQTKNQILKLLEEKKGDVNGTDENDAKRWRDVVDLFIDKFKCPLNKGDEKGSTIAHLFVEVEHEHFFQLFELDDRRFEISNIEEVERDDASFVELLISEGVDFHCENKRGNSALQLSIQYNLHHILLVILKHTRDVSIVDEYGKTLLHLYVENCCDYKNRCRDNELMKSRYSAYTSRYATRIVRILLDKGCSPAAYALLRRTPVQDAIRCNVQMSVIELLLDDRLKNCETNSATVLFDELLQMSAWWDESIVDYLLEVLRTLTAKGADVNAKSRYGRTPLYHAIEGGNRRAVDLLNNHGADFSVVTEFGDSLLHTLAQNYYQIELNDSTQESLFELLASKGCCDVNARGLGKKTPLHLAARGRNLVIARKLVERGAEVNCRDGNMNTPLHLAAQSNHSRKTVELLLKSGADVNCKDHLGRRPLFFAATSESNGPMLLKWGAYVNVYTMNKSPLSRAIENLCWSNAQEMLAYGADVNDASIVALLRKIEPGEKTSTDWGLYRTERQKEEARNRQEIFVMQHWIKLNVAQLPCSKRYTAFANCIEYQQLHRECLEEIDTLKTSYIDGRTSIYAFLHMNFGGKRVFVNNEKLQELVDCPNLEQRFPNYSVVILAGYRETVRWKSLLEPAKRAWIQLTNVELPDECIERIFAFLTNEDLVSMIEHE